MDATGFNSFMLKPSEAKFFHSENFIFKQDPYVVITVEEHEFRTSIDKNGGLNPHWSDVFNLKGLEGAMTNIKVYDREVFIADHLLGEAMFSLAKTFFGQPRKQRIDLFKNSQKVGELYLEFQPGNVEGGLPMETPLTTSSSLKSTSGTTNDKSVLNAVKENIGNLGAKVGAIGEKIESAVTGLVSSNSNPASQTGNSTTQAKAGVKTSESSASSQRNDNIPTTSNLSGVSLPSSDIPASLSMEVLKPVSVGDNVPDIKTQDFKHEDLRRQGDVANVEKSVTSTNDKPVLDKSNTEYFGQEQPSKKAEPVLSGSDSMIPAIEPSSGFKGTHLEVQGQEFNKIPKSEHHDIGEDKLGQDGLGDSSVNTQNESWSATSNRGSVIDKSELETTQASLLEQGKDKLVSLGNQIVDTIVHTAPGLVEKTQHLIENAAGYVDHQREVVVAKSNNFMHNVAEQAPVIMNKAAAFADNQRELIVTATNKGFDEVQDVLADKGHLAKEKGSEVLEKVAHAGSVAGTIIAETAKDAASTAVETGKNVSEKVMENSEKAINTASEYADHKREVIVAESNKLFHDVAEKAPVVVNDVLETTGRKAEAALEKTIDVLNKTAGYVDHKREDIVTESNKLFENVAEQAPVVLDKTAHYVDDKRAAIVAKSNDLMKETGKKAEHALERSEEVLNKTAGFVDHQREIAVKAGNEMIDEASKKIPAAIDKTAKFVDHEREIAVGAGNEMIDETHDALARNAPGVLEAGHQIREKASLIKDKAAETAKGVVEKGKQVYSNMTDSQKTSTEHPNIHLENSTKDKLFEKSDSSRPHGDIGEPNVVEKSKETTSDFTHEAQDATTKPIGTTNEVSDPEGPKDVDIVDIGPQDYSIDKKFNDTNTFDKAGQTQKQALFDDNFNSDKLIKKAEELSRHEGVSHAHGSEGLIKQADGSNDSKVEVQHSNSINFGKTNSKDLA